MSTEGLYRCFLQERYFLADSRLYLFACLKINIVDLIAKHLTHVEEEISLGCVGEEKAAATARL